MKRKKKLAIILKKDYKLKIQNYVFNEIYLILFLEPGYH